MSDRICMHYYVTGKVQGVWFRAETQKKAQSCDLTGWVRNLADGRVEVLACGEKDKVAELQKWLAHGPQLAKVTDLFSEEVTWEIHPAFEVV